ncbi:hypothetical protein JCM9157_1528 [Halalkalibacter akibai JCM 9157]|uniref:Uncharacterized protein n=1 Tax=Halalkalibacter akibai (strain ATCC 43226 / DSM 21942 / CIP 109018 / JCM 9157 / 1139) TaxID=1236973 RepID=W4QT39_HALA3|nr:hypothetical protein JCM9157_1528 [Halalkalibacter akibai JCM 9157]
MTANKTGNAFFDSNIVFTPDTELLYFLIVLILPYVEQKLAIRDGLFSKSVKKLEMVKM